MTRSEWFRRFVEECAERLPELESAPPQDFINWLWNNQEMYEYFEKYASDAIRAKRRKFSCYMIRERVRWYVQIEYERTDYKFQNNWTPYMARALAIRLPELLDIFSYKGPVLEDAE